MTTTTLKSMPYAQAKVIINDNGTINLVSYVTTVCVISPEGWLTVNRLYSSTTRKHIGAFMKEYCGCYYQLSKQIYNDNLQYNINTGEVRPLI